MDIADQDSSRPPEVPAPAPRATALLLALAAAYVVLQAALAARRGEYGYFIDEFYYLACARHPALGYVDHPPLSILFAKGARVFVGNAPIV